jgi:hypothetical protein
MAEKRYETRTGETLLREDGIVRISMFSGKMESLADAKENFAIFIELCQDCKRPVLIVLNNVRGITPEARRFYSGDEAAKYISASAFVVASPVSRVLGTFFLGLNKPAYPVRLFTSEAEAIEWLKEFAP